MAKKVSLLALALVFVLVLLSPALAQGQGGPEVLSSSTSIEFPTQLTFNVSAQSDVNIVDIRLRYTVERESFAQVTSESFVEFKPAPRVEASWTLEMIKTGGLPPDTRLSYWWLITDAAGKKIESKPAPVQFDDARYQWHKLSEGMLTLYWYQGADSFARELLTAADGALAMLSRDVGARLDTPVEIYIYASSTDLQGAMIFPEQWVGGGAFIGFGAIALGISPDNLDWGKTAVAHELAHLTTYEMTRNPYSGIPTWLDEGLATHAQGPLTPGNLALLEQAAASGSLISVRSLSSPFSAQTGLVYLSYSESQSLVEFLIDTSGQAKMLELLNTFKEGATYDGALKKVYGFDMDGLYDRWQESLARQFQKSPQAMAPAPALAFAAY